MVQPPPPIPPAVVQQWIEDQVYVKGYVQLAAADQQLAHGVALQGYTLRAAPCNEAKLAIQAAGSLEESASEQVVFFSTTRELFTLDDNARKTIQDRARSFRNIAEVNEIDCKR